MQIHLHEEWKKEEKTENNIRTMYISTEINMWSTVIVHRNTVCHHQKASQNNQNDHLMNTEVFYIYIFCFFS